jgi:hypothetical protein
MLALGQIGTIPFDALIGRTSQSANAAQMALVLKELALTPEERIEKALALGIAALADDSRRHPSSNR